MLESKRNGNVPLCTFPDNDLNCRLFLFFFYFFEVKFDCYWKTVRIHLQHYYLHMAFYTTTAAVWSAPFRKFFLLCGTILVNKIIFSFSPQVSEMESSIYQIANTVISSILFRKYFFKITTILHSCQLQLQVNFFTFFQFYSYFF